MTLKIVSLITSMLIVSLTASIADELGLKIDNALNFSASQLDTLADEILENSSQFLDYTNPAGKWEIKTNRTWCAGFTPGLFWQMYSHFGDTIWHHRARAWTNNLKNILTASDSDAGFKLFDSFGLGYFVTGESNEDYLNALRTGADIMYRQRFNPTIGFFRTWPASKNNSTDLPFEINIDFMMNLELPLYVGIKDGIQAYVDACVSHADRTWEELVRADGSTYHVVAFNLDGSVAYRRTHQGWKTESTWSRGQAWATYGYTMMYRLTKLPRMLDHAEACFDYFVESTANQSQDGIPYSDFDAPVDSRNPHDTSAAAILASAAIELYGFTGESKYLNTARTILSALSGPSYLAKGTAYQSLLRKASEKWGEPEEAAVFGDYFFVEAGLRYLELFPLDSAAGKLINISTRGFVGSGDRVLIGGFVLGADTQQVLIQALGPELADDGVSEVLADPVLQVFNAEKEVIASNDDWEENAIQAQWVTNLWAGSPPLAIGSLSAALLLTLGPGEYTAVVSGKNGSDGVALVEVYEVD